MHILLKLQVYSLLLLFSGCAAWQSDMWGPNALPDHKLKVYWFQMGNIQGYTVPGHRREGHLSILPV